MGVLVSVLVIAIVGGIIAYLINRAPFIASEFKTIGVYGILVVVVILVALQLLPLIQRLG